MPIACETSLRYQEGSVLHVTCVLLGFSGAVITKVDRQLGTEWFELTSSIPCISSLDLLSSII